MKPAIGNVKADGLMPRWLKGSDGDAIRASRSQLAGIALSLMGRWHCLVLQRKPRKFLCILCGSIKTVEMMRG
jgi:hypothetical protein